MPDPNFIGPPPPPKPWFDAQDMQSAGSILSIAGAGNQALGAWYAADAQKSELKSRALSAEFEASMSRINARAAEVEAQDLLDQGQQRILQQTMQAGQEIAAERVGQAARGITGEGSAAEVIAGMTLVKEIDTMNLDVNAVRAANNARADATNYRNRASLATISASNIRRTASTINPGLAAFSQALASSGDIIDRFDRRDRRR